MTNQELARLLIAAANALLSDQGPAPREAVRRRISAAPRTWVVVRGKTGPVPRFVREMTGLSKKYAIIAKFGDGATFTEGGDLPSAN